MYYYLVADTMSKQALDNVMNSLNGQTELLMKKHIISLGKFYDVMDSNQSKLFSVRLDWGSNMAGNMLAGQLGRWAGRMMHYTYSVYDGNNEIALEINKGSGAFKSTFQVVEPETGEKMGSIYMKRSLIGGMNANWLDASSNQPTINTKGNIMRRQYTMLNQNMAEVATVRHKIVAVRDVWTLNITDSSDSLHAVIFATVLDFEKEM